MLKDALTLSALIAAVLLVRAAFKNRVPKRLLYALWLVVLLKLCLPGTAYALPLLPAEQTDECRTADACAGRDGIRQKPYAGWRKGLSAIFVLWRNELCADASGHRECDAQIGN